MSQDYRIEVGFISHPKTRKLIRLCGAEGCLCLIALWEYATINFPEGYLKGMDCPAIEDAVRWPGTPGHFYRTLLELHFLDDSNPLKLHDWEEHQPWVIGAKQRKINASKAGMASVKARHSTGRSNGSLTERTNPYPTNLIVPTDKPSAAGVKPLKTGVQKPVFDTFSEFWKSYPKRDGKGRAIKAWGKIKPDAVLFGKIMDGLERAKKSLQWTKEGGQYIPLPASWLNDQGWESEYKTGLQPAHGGRASELEQRNALNMAEAARRIIEKERNGSKGQP